MDQPICTTTGFGIIEYRLDGQLHRTDGPARIFPDRTEVWYQHGKMHRTDGPALIWPGNREEWWQYGRLSRVDGPARIYADGTEEYWLNDEKVDIMVHFLQRK